MGDEATSRQLIERAVSGSKPDLELLLRSVQDRVHALALRMLRDREQARDATQEILVKLATNLAGFRHESAFGTWVYRVAANHLMNVRRQESEFPAFDFKAAAAQLDAALAATRGRPESDDPVLIEQVGVFCTQGMLLCLDRELRIAYILGEILQLSSEEAAAVLEVTPDAFRKRLSRARTLLYEFMRVRCGLVEPRNEYGCRCEKLAEFCANPSAFPFEPVPVALRRPLSRMPGEAELKVEVDELRAAAEAFRSLTPRLGDEDFVAAIRGAIGSGF